MRVFRYFDCLGAHETLRQRKLRLADPRNFNDPFEITPRMNPVTRDEVAELLSEERFVRKYYAEVGKVSGHDESQSKAEYLKLLPARIEKIVTNGPETAQSLRLQLLEHFSNGFRLLCCSHTHESILMWSHYAEKHGGLVLEFETNELSSNLNVDSGTNDVIYRTSPPTLPNMPWTEEQWIKCMTQIIRTKAIHWSYEEEVRIWFPLPLGMRTKATFEMQIQPAAIKTAILGCKAEPKFADAIRQILADPDYAHVEQFGAYVHESDYKLAFVPLAKRTASQ
jgi:hypothetical protein